MSGSAAAAVRLTADGRRELRDALLSAFPTGAALAQMVSLRLDRNLEAIAGGRDLSEIAFALVQRAEAEGWVEDLVAKAREDNPGNAALARLDLSSFAVPASVPDPIAVTEGQQTPAGVQVGLLALHDLMRAPEVRAAVADFQADFAVAVEQIQLLSGYKDLHDLLHTLQFRCSKTIAAEARRFPDDESSREILADHELTLKGIVDGLGEVADRIRVPPPERLWIRDLLTTHAQMVEAIAKSDAALLQRVVWTLERVLSIQPSQVNIRLNAAARALRLSAVVAALEVVRARLRQLPLDERQLRDFERGIGNLATLNEKLLALVAAHDTWQSVDLELRRVRAASRHDVMELELTWPQLEQMLPPEGGADEWTWSLTAEVRAVAQALERHDDAASRQAFQRYYSRASDCFYRVDLALKRVCEDLRAVGEPLAFLLKVLE